MGSTFGQGRISRECAGRLAVVDSPGLPRRPALLPAPGAGAARSVQWGSPEREGVQGDDDR